jgi:hypothetical protein
MEQNKTDGLGSLPSCFVVLCHIIACSSSTRAKKSRRGVLDYRNGANFFSHSTQNETKKHVANPEIHMHTATAM